MPRKIHALNQEDSQDNSSKKKEETLAERLQREAEEKVRETLMPEAKAELRKELAKEIEEMKRQAMAELEKEKRRLADERKTFEEERKKLEEREKKFQEQIDSANEEIRQKVDSANALIDKANALISKTDAKPKKIKSAQKRTEKKTGQEEHGVQESQEEQENADLEEIEKVEVKPIGIDEYTLRFREYRKRKIEEYKKITGNNSIEPGPKEITIITVDNEVIKVEKEYVDFMDENFDTFAIGENTKNQEIISRIIKKQTTKPRKVKAVIFGENIHSINEFLFYNMGTTCKDAIFNENLTRIENYAFRKTGLQEVMLPPKLRSIGNAAFSLCRKLKNVVFGEKVEEIGECAFCNNTRLQEVKLPPNLAKINVSVFEDCINLERVTFGENIEVIEYRAFIGTQLEEVTIPDTTKVGKYVFDKGVKITRKPPEEMRKSRISHQDVVKTVTEQLLDEEKIGEVRTSTELQEKVEEHEQRD